MRIFNLTFLTHAYQYVYENLSCLTYGIEVLPEQTMYFTAYFALVKDIAEAYGSWVAFIIVLMTAVATMVSIQQLVTYCSENFKFSGNTGLNNNINSNSTDSFFSSFNFFKFFKK